MEEIIDKISDSDPLSDDEYMGVDGLLHCKKCSLKLRYSAKRKLSGASVNAE